MSAPPRRQSPRALMLRSLRRNRTAMLGAAVLLVLYLGAFFAAFLSPYGHTTQHRDHNWQPPRLGDLHLWDDTGTFQGPFVYALTRPDAFSPWEEDRSQVVPLRMLVRGDAYTFLGVASDLHLYGVDAGAPPIFLLGSDQFGRCLLSRVAAGARISLSVGIIGILISMTIGLLVGGVAGYFGGRVDFLAMRLVELFLAIPSLYLILTVRQAFGSEMTSTESYLVMVVVLAFVAWAGTARVIRGMVLSIREHDYVMAAQALGLSRLRIITRHILPNTATFVIVTATLAVPYYILGEVALSFLGVGIQEPDASWGNMLRDAQNVRYLTDYPWVVLPGFFIFLAVLAFNFLGDGLRDAADPRSLGR